MSRLDLYLLRRIAGTFAIVFLSVAGLAVTLDLLANANKAMQVAGDVGGLGRYALARLPLIAQKLAPIVGLLTALLTLLGLARSGELAAAAAIGAGQGRTVRALLPAAAMVALSLFAIGEFATPPAANVLRAMGLNPFARIARPTDAVWLRQGEDIVRIGRVSPDEATLTDVSVFRRSADGLLAEAIIAERAERTSAGWTFRDVAIRASDNTPPQQRDTLDWSGPLGPKSFQLLAAHPAELPLSQIRTLARSPGASPKPRFFYDHYIHLKFAAPIAAGLLLLLAVPFAGRMTRGRSLARPLALGLVVGFAYFVFENLMTAAAESGAVSAIAGAWGPPALLACVILAFGAFQERPG